mgnify:CR=1 FL=1
MVVDEEESMEQAISKPMELFNSSATMELFNSSAKISKRTSSIRNLEDTRTKSFVFFVALTAALGGLIFGYDIGGAGATFVMDGFREHFGWSCAVGTYIYTQTQTPVLRLTLFMFCHSQ